MFDIGWGELVLIGLVALIVIGPKELPTVLRTAGQWVGRIKRMAAEFQGQFQEALREAEVADLKKQADDLTSSLSSISSYDPLADHSKTTNTENWETSDEAPTPSETPVVATESSLDHATLPAPAEEHLPVAAVDEQALPAAVLDTPPPEPVRAATAEDLKPAEAPVPKPAGGTA
ncbi:MAG TPA: Sec-independent protein translocase protein TatB [Pseudolabrys sp.]|jgi:sec-independent protein translocase protein TatB|nr:Sec-independent protein translocase protein TatB [Pseudolabrys sp.]